MNLWNFITLFLMQKYLSANAWLDKKFYFIDWKLDNLYQWLNNREVKEYIKKLVARSYVELKGFHLPYDFGKIGTIKGVPEYGWYTKPAQVIREALKAEYEILLAQNKGNQYWLTILVMSKGGWLRALFAAFERIIMFFAADLAAVAFSFGAGYLSAELVEKGIVGLCYDKWVEAEMDKIKAYRRSRGIPLDEPITADDFKYASSMTLAEFAGWCIQEYFNDNGRGYMDAQVLEDSSDVVKRALSEKMSKAEFFSYYRKSGLQRIYKRGDSGDSSSCIMAMWFDFQNSNLYVQFNDKKKTIYGYYGISWRDMVQFVEQKTDSSIGVWFNFYIRGTGVPIYRYMRFYSQAEMIEDFAYRHKDDNKTMPLISVPPLEIPPEPTNPPDPDPDPESDPPPEPEPVEPSYKWVCLFSFYSKGHFSDYEDMEPEFPTGYAYAYNFDSNSYVRTRDFIKDGFITAYNYKVENPDEVLTGFVVDVTGLLSDDKIYQDWGEAARAAKSFTNSLLDSLRTINPVGDEVIDGELQISAHYYLVEV